MNSERIELFPTIVHRLELDAHESHLAACLPVLDGLFSHCERGRSAQTLEVGEAISTFTIERELFRLAEFAGLAKDILHSTALVTGFNVAFVEMWANRHHRGGRTLEHLHGAQICGAYYLRIPPDSGGLIFRTPLEYALCGSPQVDAVESQRPDGIAHRLQVNDGVLVLFPGWLKHLTEPSRSDDPRVVVSFNLRITGLYDRLTKARSHSE